MNISLLPKTRRRRCTEKTPSAHACGVRIVLYRALWHVAATFLVLHASRFIPGCHAAKQGHMIGQGEIVLEDGDGVFLEEDSLEQGVIWNNGNIELEEEESIDLFEIKVAEEPVPAMYQSVPVDVFERKLREAHTAYDIIRIYYNKTLTDAEIDRIMEEQISAARVEWGNSTRKDLRDVERARQGYTSARPSAPPVKAWAKLQAGKSSHHHIQHHLQHRQRHHLDLPQGDQPQPNPDFFITYNYKNFTPKRRHRRHHKRKDTPTSASAIGQHGSHSAHAPTHSSPRGLNRHLNNSSGRSDPVPRSGHIGKEASTKLDPDMEEALWHMRENKRHKCEPVPVSVSLRSVHPKHPLRARYQPDCTMLPRCRKDSTCCGGPRTCEATATKIVPKPFLELEMSDDGEFVIPGPNGAIHPVKWFNFTVDTACECREQPTLPDCKHCPLPFTLSRPNITDCVCDCDKENTDFKRCKKMKQGRWILEKTYLSCIKNEQCEKPTCRYGPFTKEWLDKGSCPPKHHRTTPEPSKSFKNVRRSSRRRQGSRQGRYRG